MKVIMYGTHLCKDTLYAIYKLEDKGADLEFRNISASLTEMKAFLKIRDEEALFDGPKKEASRRLPAPAGGPAPPARDASSPPRAPLKFSYQ